MALKPFATVDDVAVLWRPLTSDESTRVAAMLPLISDMLRQAGKQVGVDLDERKVFDPTYASVLKSTTVDIVGRAIRQSTTGDPVTQESQSAMGYSWSGTYTIPGGGLGNCIMYSDLRRLGLEQQTMEAIDLCPRISRACR